MLFLLAFVCFGSILSTWYVSKQTAKNALHKKRQQLAAKGIPVDDESLTAFHRSQCLDENASQWMRVLDSIGEKKLSQQIATMNSSSDRVRYCQPDYAWLEQPMYEQMLADNSEALDQLIKLAQDNGPVYMPIKFQSMDTLFRYAQFAGEAANLLAIEAIIAARNGEPDREFRAINAMFGCSIAIRGEPSWISQASVYWSHRNAVAQVQNAIRWNRLDAAQLEHLKQRLATSWDIEQVLSLAIQGDLGMMTPPKTGQGVNQYFSNYSYAALVQSGNVDRAAVRFASSLEKALEVDFDDKQRLLAQIKEVHSEMIRSKLPFDLDQLFFPTLKSATSAIIGEQVYCDLAVIGVNIRLFERKHGRLPNVLSELESMGVDLKQFKSVDGSIPLYRLLDPAEQSSANCRAVVWSFDFETEEAISPEPPQQKASEELPAWWHWEFK